MQHSTDAYAQNRRLGRGVNIIGYDNALWRSWKQGRMQGRHFRMIKQAGFDHVRINLHPFKHMGEAPDYPINQAWLETLDWAVEQALSQGLLAILDMHEYNAMAKDAVSLKPKSSGGSWLRATATLPPPCCSSCYTNPMGC
jgi:endoglucanase